MFENIEDQKNKNEAASQAPRSVNPVVSSPPNEDFSQRIDRLHREGAEKGGKKGLIIGIIAFLLIAGGATAGYLFWPEISGVLGINGGKPTKIEEEAVCQDDTNTCPDGSTVKRIQPNCEFAACPDEEMPCGEEGEKASAGQSCCENLKNIPDSYFDEEAAECKTEEGEQTICANCGNGECGPGENKCNCPEDCKEEIDISDWQTYQNKEYGFEIKYPKDWVMNSNDKNIFYLASKDRSEFLKDKDNINSPFRAYDVALEIKDELIIDGKKYSIQELIEDKGVFNFINNLDINSIKAINGVYVTAVSDSDRNILFEKNDKIFEFTVNNDGRFVSNTLDISDQIIKFFKFIDKNEISDSSTPKEIYQKYLDAVQGNDFNAIKDLSVAGNKDFEEATPEEQELYFQVLKNMQAVEIRIVDEIIEGNRAVVIAQGKSNPSISKNFEIKDAPSYGIITFKKDGTGWKIAGDNWTDTSAQVNMENITKGKGFSYWDVGHHCNSTKDENQCEGYETENEKSRCYSCFGELKGDVSLCEKTTLEFDKEKCYMEIAKLTSDQDLCVKITDANLKKMCDSAIDTASYLNNTNVYTLDFDNDGLNFVLEIKFATDIDNPDTDGDSYKDGDEVKNGYNPSGEGKL